MSRSFSFIVMMIASSICSAQNVGIGTSSPNAKLTLVGSESTPNGLNAAIRVVNSAAGGNSWYLRVGATGTNTPAGGFSIGDNISYRMVISDNGNVGIGSPSPTARLHISGGGIKIDGSQALEFGAGITKEANAGKITYGAYSPNILEITGGGTASNNRSIRFFNEGVAWFNGPIYMEAGNLTRLATGTAHLLPVAYGEVNSAGSITVSSGNFTVTKVGTGAYTIVVNGLFTQANVTVLVTPKGANTPRMASYTAGTFIDNIHIYIYDKAGIAIDGGFSFAVHFPAG